MTGSARDLSAFFAPRGVAVIGAAADQRAGGRVLAALDRFGYAGGVYPVTRSHAELFGRACYRTIGDVPDPVDLAVVAIGAAGVPDALRECGRRGIPAAIVFATGFGGETPDGPRLQQELEAALRESGVRILGPNTLGLRFVPSGLFATFAHDVDSGVRPGNVAVIAQSGGLGVYLGAAVLRRRLVGTRYLVDTGNELDLGSAEVLEHIARDRAVSCVGLLLEGSRDGRRLAAAVERAVSSGIPVVFFKVGRSRSASTHITSHTGALASPAELFDAAMRDAGASVAHDEAEFLDALVIHDAGKAPKGRRLGVVTPSGGYAILTLDAAEQFGMELPQPVEAPTAEEEPDLRSGTLRNPYDWASVGGARPGTRVAAVGWMLRQPNVDAVLLWEAYNMEMERREEVRAALSRVLPGADKPLFLCGTSTPEFEETLKGLDVILFNEPMRLVRSLSVVAPPADAPPAPEAPHPAAGAQGAVTGAAARRLLSGIEHVESVPLTSGEQAAELCRRWGKAFLKVESDAHPHKTELRLVEGPLDEAAAPRAFDRLAERRSRIDESAPIVAQPAVGGVELALGAYHDPTFGPAVMVATGGIFLEVVRDARFALAPLDEDSALRLIRGLRGAPLLLGARGRPPADVRAAARALAALSRFIAGANGEYASVDVNPLMVREEGKGAVAVDAIAFRAR